MNNMKYLAFLLLPFFLSGCTKTKLETTTYNGFKIMSITVNKIPFADLNHRYFDEDSLIDLCIKPYDQTKKAYRYDNCSPNSLPLELKGADNDSTDIYNANAYIPIYLYDLDDDAINADFIGRVAFYPSDYIGKENFTIQNPDGGIDLAFSVIWYKQ